MGQSQNVSNEVAQSHCLQPVFVFKKELLSTKKTRKSHQTAQSTWEPVLSGMKAIEPKQTIKLSLHIDIG